MIMEKENNIFSEFRGAVIHPTNQVDSINIIVEPGQTRVIASLSLQADDKINCVWLTACVGWNPSASDNGIRFKIFRNSSTTGLLVFAADDYRPSNPNKIITSISHVDAINGKKVVKYFLLAESISANDVNVIGPVTFTAITIKSNSVSARNDTED
jgi:hypothetical protein